MILFTMILSLSPETNLFWVRRCCDNGAGLIETQPRLLLGVKRNHFPHVASIQIKSNATLPCDGLFCRIVRWQRIG